MLEDTGEFLFDWGRDLAGGVTDAAQCRFCRICKGHRDGAAALGVREDAAIEQAGGHLDDGAESEVNEAAIAKPPPRPW